MTKAHLNRAKKVLVTGSRGKSSLARLIHAAFCSAGINSRGRITGVVPREMTPTGERQILRSAGAHVEEMRWWLRQLPQIDGVVMENSAVAPELQGLAARWLRPDLIVLTNVFPDHQEVWGPTEACAIQALVAGIPNRSWIVLPASAQHPQLLAALQRLQCRVTLAPALPKDDHHQQNIELAVAVVENLGLDPVSARQAMLTMRLDRYDFQVARNDGVELALAFTANDLTSTERLFKSLHWKKEETCLVFNHRADRPGRFESFIRWIGDLQWREVVIIGDRPRRLIGVAQYLDIKTETSLLERFRSGDRVFGCGNVAGVPLQLAESLTP